MYPHWLRRAGSSRVLLSGLALGLILLATIELPGKEGKHPRLRLAVCSKDGCYWGDLIFTLDAGNCCRIHGLHRSRWAKEGERVEVKCFVRNCTELVILEKYSQERATHGRI